MAETMSLLDMRTDTQQATEVNSVKEGIWKEHERLDAILSLIPRKAQHGVLMSCDLVLTCIDANEHFIALGTNVGITFLYSRKEHVMQRLKAAVSGEILP